jgi:DNA mismatch endonuclease, patch repair protein
MTKISWNQARDTRNVAALAELGWRALVIWECELKDEAETEIRLRSFLTPY